MTPEKSKWIGKRVGAYEIRSALGAGGMGEVYRAHDSQLKREVAIKALPDAFAEDADRLARFQREAQILASINHPNIAAIYGLETAERSRFLVLELVEGETLAARIARGAMPMDEGLAAANQIAEALAAAHEKGITHRDLKPANIKITPNGSIKVLDFGLAKVRETHHAAAGADTPTSLSTSTPGVIIGTPAYMSPERAKGKETDHTEDVWGFGCVLYEMLTGRRAFGGESVTEILSEILKSEPDWTRLPAETPESIRRLLRRCLQKDRTLRLHDIADVRLEIHDAQLERASPERARPKVRPGPGRLVMASCVLFGLLAGGLLVRTLLQDETALPPELRLEITTPPTTDPVSIAVSPDGRKLLFVATSDGRARLWLRSFDSPSARALPGTEDAMFPFWAPDSRSAGFFTESKLKRIDTVSGEVQSLADGTAPRGGTWNDDGVIVFAPTSGNSALSRVSAAGGEVKPLTNLTTLQVSHRFPQFLPDGRHFLFYAQGTPDVRGLYVGDLDGSEPKRLFDKGENNSAASFLSSGHLVFVSNGTLFSQRFDPIRLTTTGNPVAVAATPPSGSALSVFTAAPHGPIVYRGGGGASKQLTWFDRSGKELGKVGVPNYGFHPALSPDGRLVALRLGADVWLIDTARGVPNKLTSPPGLNMSPVWSPDGERVLFTSNRNGEYDLYVKNVTGTGPDRLLLEAGGSSPLDWSSDGRLILYETQVNKDLWVLPLDEDKPGKPYPVVQSDSTDRLGQFSPDQKWIAYQSNESGNMEIYVQPLPGRDGKSGRKQRISPNGGTQVRWRRDGEELFYISADSKLIAVPLQTSPDGQTIKVGTPTPLFSVTLGGAWNAIPGYEYMVAPGGKQFLVNTVIEVPAPPMIAIFNWKPQP